MRYPNLSLLALAAAIALGTTAADARSFKRGVGDNLRSLDQLTLIEHGTQWYYTWGQTPGTIAQNYDGMEFVSMSWNGLNENGLRNFCAQHPEVKYLLGFNEPNFKKQANKTPQQAANEWPRLRAIADELGLELVAPAVNYSPDAPYQDIMSWMDEFDQLVGRDAYDYVAIHIYGPLGLLTDNIQKFYNKFGKKVWVTEYNADAGSNSDGTADHNLLISSVNWMERSDMVFRYAWFMNFNNNSAFKNISLVENDYDWTTQTSTFHLTELGMIYTYMSEFDTSRFYAVDEKFPAVDYVNCHAIDINAGNNAAAPKPIELSKFSGGSWADYQLDVPVSGSYFLELEVCGEGEPVRWDPKLSVFEVNSDESEGAEVGTATQFALPGNYTTYSTVRIPCQLKAGKQTIRLKDVNAYQPSNIHISTVKLVGDASGIAEAAIAADNAPVDVFTTTGIRIRSNVNALDAVQGLTPGIYLVGNRKVLVK